MKVFTCEDKSTTTLHYRDIIAMVIIVSSDVVAGVATADDNYVLSLDVLPRRRELRRMD